MVCQYIQGVEAELQGLLGSKQVRHSAYFRPPFGIFLDRAQENVENTSRSSAAQGNIQKDFRKYAAFGIFRNRIRHISGRKRRVSGK